MNDKDPKETTKVTREAKETSRSTDLTIFHREFVEIVLNLTKDDRLEFI